MQTGLVVAGRYRILRRLTESAANAVWLAEDEQTGFFVLASVLPLSRAQLLRSAVGLPHPHLAALIDLLGAEQAGALPDGVKLERGACLAIAEWISGGTLYDQLLDGRLSLVAAVRTVASIASAVSAMHARGAVHGAISTRSIVMDRSDGGTVPVLTQGAVPADGSFCSLERIEGRGPCEGDDSWALHVVLYNVLTGRRPYRAKSHDALVRALRSARPIPLAALDVDDMQLSNLVERGLVPTARASICRASELETLLYQWLGEHGQPSSVRRPDADETSPHIEIGALVDASSPGLRVETPTVMPPPVADDLHEGAQATGQALGDGAMAQSLDAGNTDPNASEPDAAAAPASEPGAAEAPVAQLPEQSEPPVPSWPGLAPSSAPSDAPALASSEAPSPHAAKLDSATPTASASVAALNERSRATWLLWLVAVVGAASIAGGVWLVSSLRATAQAPSPSAPPARVPGSASAHPAAPAASSTILAPAGSDSASSAQPGAPRARASTPAEVAACNARWFPAETFQVGQDLSFVCSVRDPRDAAKRMRRRVVVGARGALTAGMREWSRLGWYQLATLATLRGDCCPNVVPFELPELKACPRLDTALDGLAQAVRTNGDVRVALAAFEEAAECAYRVQPQDYSYSHVPKSGGQFAFDELLARGGK